MGEVPIQVMLAPEPREQLLALDHLELVLELSNIASLGSEFGEVAFHFKIILTSTTTTI
jgi:hypothetical protein